MGVGCEEEVCPSVIYEVGEFTNKISSQLKWENLHLGVGCL